MTYNGGIEDGKANLASEILNIIGMHHLSFEVRLNMIRKLCEELVKK